MSQQTLEWANDIDNDNVAAAWAGLMLIMSIVATIGVLWLLPVKDEQQV
jgi:type IV secretory pathway component VirB8